MKNPAVVLFLITLVSGLLLGGVNAVTLPKALEQQQIALNNNLQEIFPDADNFTSIKVNDESITNCYEVQKTSGGTSSAYELIGYVIQTSPKGYGGAVEVLTGIDLDGVIVNVKITSHAETPGLGANADKPVFLDQYIGQTGDLTVVKRPPANSEIQAVSSATITSSAVTRGVNAACVYFNSQLSKGGAK